MQAPVKGGRASRSLANYLEAIENARELIRAAEEARAASETFRRGRPLSKRRRRSPCSRS
jgi:hypothetical protein